MTAARDVDLLGLSRARPIAEYHEDMGAVLWWKFPITEPPYVGTPNDLGIEIVVATTIAVTPPYDNNVWKTHVGGWPGYHTHFTPIPIPKVPE